MKEEKGAFLAEALIAVFFLCIMALMVVAGIVAVRS